MHPESGLGEAVRIN